MNNLFSLSVLFLLGLFDIQSMGQTARKPSINVDNIFEVNIENLLRNKQTFILSKIASNVEYIKLETNDECIIGNGKYFFTDSLIFVNNRDHILKFSMTEDFFKK